MGCLKNLAVLAILILAVIGFLSIGGDELVMHGINGVMNPPADKIEKKAQKVADFSQVSDNYEIKRAVSVMGVKAVLTEHKETHQKMVLADTGSLIQITQEDIKSDGIETKLTSLADKYGFIPSVKVKRLKVVEMSEMKAFGKTMPYVKINADLEGLPYDNVEGIVGVVVQKDGSSKLAISGSKEGKFKKEIAETFFNSLREN